MAPHRVRGEIRDRAYTAGVEADARPSKAAPVRQKVRATFLQPTAIPAPSLPARMPRCGGSSPSPDPRPHAQGWLRPCSPHTTRKSRARLQEPPLAPTTTAAHHCRYASANAPIEARTSLSAAPTDRKSTRLNSSHPQYLVCRLLLEKKKITCERMDRFLGQQRRDVGIRK